MSIEAITYVKSMDVSDPISRLLLLIIGENTFNDSGLCKVGQKVLVEETRTSESTVRRHLKTLKSNGVVDIHPQFGADGARSVDAIELLGFLEWLPTTRRAQPVKPTTGQNDQGARSSADRGGRSLVTGSYKETVQETVQENAHAREVDKSGFEKNGRPLPAMSLTTRDVSWRKWIDHLRLIGKGDLADDAEAVGAMTVCKRWPEADTPLPKVNRRPIVAKQLADRVVGEGA